jgi:2,3-bisphosphoglycerate-dependent phosphoglycerate mutase
MPVSCCVSPELFYDVCFTSMLKRAIHTLWAVLQELNMEWLPVTYDWRLNERHYGALQGKNKAETALQIGVDQVYAWRRSYDARPPLLSRDDPQHPRFDRRYQNVDPVLLPAGESLRDTLVRVMPCWKNDMEPRLRLGENVLVVAHGNSLRALVKYLDHVSEEDVPDIYLPTGVPLVYEFDGNMRLQKRNYLGDPDVVRAATEAGKLKRPS